MAASDACWGDVVWAEAAAPQTQTTHKINRTWTFLFISVVEERGGSVVLRIPVSSVLLFHTFCSKEMSQSNADARRGSRCQAANARIDGQTGTHVPVVVNDRDLSVQRRSDRQVILHRSAKQQGLVGLYVSIE